MSLITTKNKSNNVPLDNDTTINSVLYKQPKITYPAIYSSGINATNSTPGSLNIIGDVRVKGDCYMNNLIVSGQASYANQAFYKNRMINGACEISQRGTSTSIPFGNGSGAYGMDMFTAGFVGGTSATVTMQQGTLSSTDTPLQYGFTKYCRLSAASVVGTSTGNWLSTYMEGNSVSDFQWGTSLGIPVTFSFWMRTSNPTSTLAISFHIRNAAATYSYNNLFLISGNNVWNYVVLTVPPPPVGSSWVVTNASSVIINFMGYSSTGTATSGWVNAAQSFYTGSYRGFSATNLFPNGTSYTLDITGVQIEKGSQVTPFEFRPSFLELNLCRRYLMVWGSGSNSFPGLGHAVVASATTSSSTSVASNAVQILIHLPAIMRVRPSLTFTGGIQLDRHNVGGAAIAQALFVYNSESFAGNILHVSVNQTSANTVGSSWQLMNNAGTGLYIVSAEM